MIRIINHLSRFVMPTVIAATIGMVFAITDISIPDIGDMNDTSNIIIEDMAIIDGTLAGGIMGMDTVIKNTTGTGNLIDIIMLPVTAGTESGLNITESSEYIDFNFLSEDACRYHRTDERESI